MHAPLPLLHKQTGCSYLFDRKQYSHVMTNRVRPTQDNRQGLVRLQWLKPWWLERIDCLSCIAKRRGNLQNRCVCPSSNGLGNGGEDSNPLSFALLIKITVNIERSHWLTSTGMRKRSVNHARVAGSDYQFSMARRNVCSYPGRF